MTMRVFKSFLSALPRAPERRAADRIGFAPPPSFERRLRRLLR
jgi:hypothetical protein